MSAFFRLGGGVASDNFVFEISALNRIEKFTYELTVWLKFSRTADVAKSFRLFSSAWHLQRHLSVVGVVSGA